MLREAFFSCQCACPCLCPKFETEYTRNEKLTDATRIKIYRRAICCTLKERADFDNPELTTIITSMRLLGCHEKDLIQEQLKKLEILTSRSVAPSTGPDTIYDIDEICFHQSIHFPSIGLFRVLEYLKLWARIDRVKVESSSERLLDKANEQSKDYYRILNIIAVFLDGVSTNPSMEILLEKLDEKLKEGLKRTSNIEDRTESYERNTAIRFLSNIYYRKNQFDKALSFAKIGNLQTNIFLINLKEAFNNKDSRKFEEIVKSISLKDLKGILELITASEFKESSEFLDCIWSEIDSYMIKVLSRSIQLDVYEFRSTIRMYISHNYLDKAWLLIVTHSNIYKDNIDIFSLVGWLKDISLKCKPDWIYLNNLLEPLLKFPDDLSLQIYINLYQVEIVEKKR